MFFGAKFMRRKPYVVIATMLACMLRLTLLDVNRTFRWNIIHVHHYIEQCMALNSIRNHFLPLYYETTLPHTPCMAVTRAINSDSENCRENTSEESCTLIG